MFPMRGALPLDPTKGRGLWKPLNEVQGPWPLAGFEGRRPSHREAISSSRAFSISSSDPLFRQLIFFRYRAGAYDGAMELQTIRARPRPRERVRHGT